MSELPCDPSEVLAYVEAAVEKRTPVHDLLVRDIRQIVERITDLERDLAAANQVVTDMRGEMPDLVTAIDGYCVETRGKPVIERLHQLIRDINEDRDKAERDLSARVTVSDGKRERIFAASPLNAEWLAALLDRHGDATGGRRIERIKCRGREIDRSGTFAFKVRTCRCGGQLNLKGQTECADCIDRKHTAERPISTLTDERGDKET